MERVVNTGDTNEMSVNEVKVKMWEKILRAELGEFASRVEKILSSLVEDDEWNRFEELSEELFKEYFDGMRDAIIP